MSTVPSLLLSHCDIHNPGILLAMKPSHHNRFTTPKPSGSRSHTFFMCSFFPNSLIWSPKSLSGSPWAIQTTTNFMSHPLHPFVVPHGTSLYLVVPLLTPSPPSTAWTPYLVTESHLQHLKRWNCWPSNPPVRVPTRHHPSHGRLISSPAERTGHRSRCLQPSPHQCSSRLSGR